MITTKKTGNQNSESLITLSEAKKLLKSFLKSFDYTADAIDPTGKRKKLLCDTFKFKINNYIKSDSLTGDKIIENFLQAYRNTFFFNAVLEHIKNIPEDKYDEKLISILLKDDKFTSDPNLKNTIKNIINQTLSHVNVMRIKQLAITSISELLELGKIQLADIQSNSDNLSHMENMTKNCSFANKLHIAMTTFEQAYAYLKSTKNLSIKNDNLLTITTINESKDSNKNTSLDVKHNENNLPDEWTANFIARIKDTHNQLESISNKFKNYGGIRITSDTIGRIKREILKPLLIEYITSLNVDLERLETLKIDKKERENIIKTIQNSLKEICVLSKNLEIFNKCIELTKEDKKENKKTSFYDSLKNRLRLEHIHLIENNEYINAVNSIVDKIKKFIKNKKDSILKQELPKELLKFLTENHEPPKDTQNIQLSEEKQKDNELDSKKSPEENRGLGLIIKKLNTLAEKLSAEWVNKPIIVDTSSALHKESNISSINSWLMGVLSHKLKSNVCKSILDEFLQEIQAYIASKKKKILQNPTKANVKETFAKNVCAVLTEQTKLIEKSKSEVASLLFKNDEPLNALEDFCHLLLNMAKHFANIERKKSSAAISDAFTSISDKLLQKAATSTDLECFSETIRLYINKSNKEKYCGKSASKLIMALFNILNKNYKTINESLFKEATADEFSVNDLNVPQKNSDNFTEDSYDFAQGTQQESPRNLY